ncbi:MAG: T9SS type A sorting domain-containing protein [Ignavibacteria bacterium]|nr:T9SS type A sorting domain-containing protein [Ignavibacteria bacterium]
MKNIIFLILNVIISFNLTYSQNGWVHQSSGVNVNLNSIYFINSNTGWVCGDSGKVLKTTNSGTNWVILASNTNLPLLSIMFADANTGWTVGGYDDNNPLCSQYPIVLRTTNGGLNWVTQISGNGFLYNDLYVVNNQTAYICNAGICCPPFCVSSSGEVAKTSNSGQNWTGSVYEASYSVYFLNNNIGWASSQRSSDVLSIVNYIYRTNNSGSNWQVVFTDTGNFNNYRNLMFLNDSTGYLINRSLKKSTNGGNSWKNTDSITTIGIRDEFFINIDTGWCSGGSGKIIRTNNGGINWTAQTSNTTNGLNSIHFVDANSGWIAGSGGKILKTVTGGLTTAGQSAISVINSFELRQNFPNPFNPVTNMEFGISELEFVTLRIYNSIGKEVTTIVNSLLNPGIYKYEFNGESLPSGIYFYKLEAGDFVETKRMVLLK